MKIHSKFEIQAGSDGHTTFKTPITVAVCEREGPPLYYAKWVRMDSGKEVAVDSDREIPRFLICSGDGQDEMWTRVGDYRFSTLEAAEEGLAKCYPDAKRIDA